ncbi:hypothetical protein GOZ92_08455 [Agrobacterium vitis]|nr:restriction endonuclease [Agrobacterium vitis]MVA24468.1 hypothetical protein [Agrobacterium vitis]
MKTVAKGAGLEELARAYFARQGFVAIRSVSIQFEDEDVTDIDVWLYGRQGGAVRTRALVDVKDKKSPKAFERVMWARGMQLALGCDRAFVTTTDNSQKVARFAHQQKVSLLTAAYLRQWVGDDLLNDRLSLEELQGSIQLFAGQKQDGDWIRQIAAAKSAVVSLAPFPAFNKAMSSFRFFSDRAATRPQHREQALRGAYLSAGLACVALDAALEKLAFEQSQARYHMLYAGVTYGDAGDNRVKNSIDTVLSAISKGVNNGRVIARQAADALDQMFTSVRAEIIAEFFAKEQNSFHLFPVARELEARAHARNRTDLTALSVEAKAVLGVFADFIGAKRKALLSSEFEAAPSVAAAPKTTTSAPPPSTFRAETVAEEPSDAVQEDGESTAQDSEIKSSKSDENPKLL